MMWNYRIFKIKTKRSVVPKFNPEIHDPDEDLTTYTYYSIKEVYYNNKNNIKSYTVDDMKPYGDTPKDLKIELNLMLKAFENPIIDKEELDKELEKKDKYRKPKKAKKLFEFNPDWINNGE